MAVVGVTRLLLVSVLLFCFIGTCFSAAGPSLKDINNSTLFIRASCKLSEKSIALKSGVDNITVTWGQNAGADTSAWKSVTVKLCYAIVSQKDRAWIVQKNTPTAYYFIRAYAYDSTGHEVAYGQTSPDKKTNIFFVEAVSGRHLSLDIASVTFSAFSVISLIGFFWLEKSRAKSAAKK